MDVLAVAAALHMPLTAHVVAVERATRAVERIDSALTAAKARGALSFLNSRYRDARRAARAQGRHFPTYGVVYSRFTRTLYRYATNGDRVSDRSSVEQALRPPF